ncbi:hypothetical protein BLFGPEAP_02647 [Candidatus Methanoperedenaceae archaeon GB50]|nr:hypothetical protein BLFGPEAP_02647 [Candidatus Methanoperedenaceae archaeon GB50]
MQTIKALTQEAIEAGFYNIDVDPSTLVDYSKPTLMEQQKENYECTAEVTAFIRSLEPEGYHCFCGCRDWPHWRQKFHGRRV